MKEVNDFKYLGSNVSSKVRWSVDTPVLNESVRILEGLWYTVDLVLSGESENDVNILLKYAIKEFSR